MSHTSGGDVCTTDRIKGFVWYRRRFTPGPPPKCLKILWEIHRKYLRRYNGVSERHFWRPERVCPTTGALAVTLFANQSKAAWLLQGTETSCALFLLGCFGFFFLFLDFPPCSRPMFRNLEASFSEYQYWDLVGKYIYIFLKVIKNTWSCWQSIVSFCLFYLHVMEHWTLQGPCVSTQCLHTRLPIHSCV